MRKRNLAENFEINEIFGKKALSDIVLNNSDAESFRDNGAKHTFIDPYYKDSIDVYVRNDGSIFVDSFSTTKLF